MTSTIQELLKNPFSEKKLEEQVRIITAGKPKSVSNFLTSAPRGNASDPNSCGIYPTLYDEVKWITACEKTLKVYCWPCLLFTKAEKCHIKISDTVHETIKNHERLPEHLEAVFKMQIFIMKNVTKSGALLSVRNDESKRTREILKFLTDAVCFATKNKSSSDRYECSFLKAEECAEILKLLRNCHKLKRDLVYDAVAFLNKSPDVLSKLVDAITCVVKVAIAKEIGDAKYVSLILNEHLTSKKKSQISAVLRYIKGDRMCERFIGFTNLVGCRWQHDSLESHILNIFKEYGVSEKIIALSADATVLPKSELSILISSLQSLFKFCHFIPSTGFGYELLQSLSVFEECRLFLRTTNAIEVFFKHVQRLQQLQAFMMFKKTWDHFTAVPFIIFLATHREFIANFFELKKPEAWSDDDVVKARAFRTYLQQQHTIFLLKTCHSIFAKHFDKNFNFIIKNSEVGIFSGEEVEEFRSSLSDNGFSRVWAHDSTENSKRPEELARATYANLYRRIINHLVQEIDVRCRDLKKLAFCGLLNYSQFSMPNFRDLVGFMVGLLLEHSPGFDAEELSSEMEIFKENPLFSKKMSASEILKTLSRYDLRDTFTQMGRLAEFTLTLPIPAASEHQETSKLSVIKDFSYIGESTETPPGEISVLCVEKEMLQELRHSENFYDDVIVNFLKLQKV